MAIKLVKMWAVTIAFLLGAIAVCLILNIAGEAGLGFDFSAAFDSRTSQFALAVLVATLSGAVVDAVRFISGIAWGTETSFHVKTEKLKRRNLA